MVKKKRTPEQMAIIREFDKKTYTPLQIKPKKSEAELIRIYASLRGESLTRLIVRCIMTDIEQETAKYPELDRLLKNALEDAQKNNTP